MSDAAPEGLKKKIHYKKTTGNIWDKTSENIKIVGCNVST